MRKAAIAAAVLMVSFGLAGCLLRETGPCVGFGCPAFSSAASQVPQPAQKAQNHKAGKNAKQAAAASTSGSSAKSGQ